MSSPSASVSLSHPHFDVSFRRWRLFAFILLAVWALELAITQHFSIPAEDHYRLLDPLARFAFAFFLLLPIVFLCPRPVVLVALSISTLFQWGTLYYHSAMGSAPEIMVLLNNVAETAEVGDAVWEMIPWHYLWFLLPVFILQVFLLYRHAPPKAFYSQRIRWSLRSVIAYGLLFGVLFAYTGRYSTPGHRCTRFGFLPIFVQDVYFRYAHLDKLKEQALKNETKRSFGLQSEYQEFIFGDIVVMQVESLDNAVLGFQMNGQPVTPFLNSLQDNSLFYRVGVPHRYGSAEADFSMLTGIPPLDICFNYRTPDLPYNTALPRFFKEQGYESACFHGVRGAFYNRRSIYTEMQFDRLMFCQEIIEAIRNGIYSQNGEPLEEAYTNMCEGRGEWLRDDVVFNAVLREINSPSECNRFFFVITATSHTPFPTKHIDDKDKLIHNEKSINDRYINSIHVVDGWIHSFCKNLPPGTLLIIYGDHTPKFRSGSFVSDVEGSHEFVPCFVHIVGQDLAALQRVPRRSTERTLSLRDVHSFLRDITERDAVLTKTEMPDDGWREAGKNAPPTTR